MMKGVDSSFEALAIIPVNLSPLFYSTLWVWLTVATAAFSFWRLRTSSLKTTSSHIPSPPPPPTTKTTTIATSTTTTSFKVIVKDDEREKFDEKDEENVVLTRGNNRKKFFTVFYEERETHPLDVDEEEEEECVVIKRWGSTGSTVELIRPSSSEFDFGWHSYQDRKVIDGSVVRLWKQDHRDSGSPRRCRRVRYFPGITKHLGLA